MKRTVQLVTRRAIAVALVAPVAFLLAYPWVFRLLPLQVQEWADLPRDLMAFLALDAVVMALVLMGFRAGAGRAAREPGQTGGHPGH